MSEEKQERTVIHLIYNGQHHYYGSIKAIYNDFTSEELGITYNSMKNYRLAEQKPYINKKCEIRKGILRTSTAKLDEIEDRTNKYI